MKKREIAIAALAVAIGLGGLTVPGATRASNFFNGMNPFKWFFGDNWDDDYYHRYRRYGWGDPYGWGGPWAGQGGSTVIVVNGEDQQDAAAVASVHEPE